MLDEIEETLKSGRFVLRVEIQCGGGHGALISEHAQDVWCVGRSHVHRKFKIELLQLAPVAVIIDHEAMLYIRLGRSDSDDHIMPWQTKPRRVWYKLAGPTVK